MHNSFGREWIEDRTAEHVEKGHAEHTTDPRIDAVLQLEEKRSQLQLLEYFLERLNHEFGDIQVLGQRCTYVDEDRSQNGTQRIEIDFF